MENRVIFFSKSDWANWSNLEQAEKVLNNIKLDNIFSIIDYIEFYNIYLFFENWIFLKKRNEDEKKKYKTLADELNKLAIKQIWKFWDNEFIEWINVLKNENLYEYKNKLIEMIYKFWSYRNISWNCILKILKDDSSYIYPILKNKTLSKYYWEEIRTFLIWFETTWELLLDKKSWKVDYYFPDCLTIEDKEKIIDNYLNKNDNIYYESAEIANLNDDNFLRINEKIKLKAENIHEKIWKEIISNWTNLKISVSVEFQENCRPPQKKIIKKQWNEVELECKFSCSKFLLENFNYELDPFSVFICVFKFLNPQWIINFLYKSCKSWIFEKIVSEVWKDWYQTNFEFMIDELLSFLNIIGLNSEILSKKNKSIEWLINNQIKILNNKMEGLEVKIDETDDSYENKIVKIAPKFDLLIKQYKSFLEYWSVNIEYSNKLHNTPFEQIPSKINNKYIYVKDGILKNATFLFFSDQSHLAYIPKIVEKFNNFFLYITSVDLKINDLENYQLDLVKYLINEWFLYENERNILKIKNPDLIYILSNIYIDWELYYNNYNNSQKEIIQKFLDIWELTTWKTLLSNKESDYFDYYLNDHKFSNWLKIRNKNLHWHLYKNKDEAKKDYYILLQLFIMLLIKIDQELSRY